MLLILVGLLGICTHTIFRSGEWHLQAPKLLLVSLTLPVFTYYSLLYVQKQETSNLWTTFQIQASFYTGLFGTIAIYRLFLHPLNSFPGPFWAKLSKWWQVKECLGAQNHLLVDKLHNQYGPVVRTGPNEVVVLDPDIIRIINTSPNFVRAPLYDLTHPLKGINVVRDRQEHAVRRRVWEPAFSPKALESYLPRLQTYLGQLDAQIFKRRDQTVLINDWFQWFSFDVMGDLALNRSFGMLAGGRWHDAIQVMHEGMSMFGPLTPVPWFCRILMSIASLIPGSEKSDGFQIMLKWCCERIAERVAEGSEASDKPTDIAQYLIQGSRTPEGGFDMPWLNGDAVAVITAGSETVGATLVYAFYELAGHPGCQEAILEELKMATNASQHSHVPLRDLVADDKELRRLPYLRGFVNEVLRLHPAVPTGGYRVVGLEGLHICGSYIPPGCIISGSRWSLARSERCFENARELIPERWSTKPELVRNPRAFGPFSFGSHSCIGQNMAQSEIRLVVALLVSRYTIRFARPGDDSVERDMKDCFSALPGSLELVFASR